MLDTYNIHAAVDGAFRVSEFVKELAEKRRDEHLAAKEGKRLLGLFMQLGKRDGNAECQAAKERLLELCPEFQSYLDSTRKYLEA